MNSKINGKYLALMFLIIMIIMPASMCLRQEEEMVTIKIICAGSLVAPFEAIEKGFEEKYTNIDIVLEAHGSIQVIRQVTELDLEADVLAVADYSLIPLLMYKDYASWYVKFATNKLGIAYTTNSLYSEEIDMYSWPEILSRDDVVLGLSDPRFDASGYRTLMVIQLAESYYNDEEIFESVFGNSFSLDIDITSNGDIVITIPEIFESMSSHIAIRGSSIQLLSLLESGAIDYAFEYENVSRYYGLHFLELPESIDLSSDTLAIGNNTLSVDIGFQRFSSILPYFIAQRTYYAVTIPNTSKKIPEATLFIEYLLSDEGKSILNSTYLNTMSQSLTDNLSELPSEIREYVEMDMSE